LAARLAQQDDLDAAIGAWTIEQDPRACMNALQSVGVSAGVCQTDEDRYDHDPQPAHLQWLTDVTGLSQSCR
jgi:hypothetical protein